MFDDDIPMPAAYIKRDFGDMKCGQSFAVPLSDAIALRKAASKYKARHVGWDYITQFQLDGNLRLWCTSVAPVEEAMDYASLLKRATEGGE